MVAELNLFESGCLSLLDFFLGGGSWMKSESYKRKVDTRDEFLARIFYA